MGSMFVIVVEGISIFMHRRLVEIVQLIKPNFIQCIFWDGQNEITAGNRDFSSSIHDTGCAILFVQTKKECGFPVS